MMSTTHPDSPTPQSTDLGKVATSYDGIPLYRQVRKMNAPLMQWHAHQNMSNGHGTMPPPMSPVVVQHHGRQGYTESVVAATPTPHARPSSSLSNVSVQVKGLPHKSHSHQTHSSTWKSLRHHVESLPPPSPRSTRHHHQHQHHQPSSHHHQHHHHANRTVQMVTTPMYHSPPPTMPAASTHYTQYQLVANSPAPTTLVRSATVRDVNRTPMLVKELYYCPQCQAGEICGGETNMMETSCVECDMAAPTVQSHSYGTHQTTAYSTPRTMRGTGAMVQSMDVDDNSFVTGGQSHIHHVHERVPVTGSTYTSRTMVGTLPPPQQQQQQFQQHSSSTYSSTPQVFFPNNQSYYSNGLMETDYQTQQQQQQYYSQQQQLGNGTLPYQQTPSNRAVTLVAGPGYQSGAPSRNGSYSRSSQYSQRR